MDFVPSNLSACCFAPLPFLPIGSLQCVSSPRRAEPAPLLCCGRHRLQRRARLLRQGLLHGEPTQGPVGVYVFRLAAGSEGTDPVLRVFAVRVWLCDLCVAAGRSTWRRRTDTSECARIHLVCLVTVNALAVFLFLDGAAILSTGTQCTGYFISSGPLSSPPTRHSRREGAAVASTFLLTSSLAAAGVCPTRRTLCAALDVTLPPQSVRYLERGSLCGALFVVAV